MLFLEHKINAKCSIGRLDFILSLNDSPTLALETPGGFVKTELLGPAPSVCFSWSGVGPENCISNKFPGGAATAGPEPHPRTTASLQVAAQYTLFLVWCLRSPDSFFPHHTASLNQ